MLATADLVSYALNGVIGSDQVRRVLDVDEESSIPTWFSSAQLLLASALLFLVAFIKSRTGERYTGHCLVLGLIFMGLSIDEMVSIHEQATLALNFEIRGLNGASWIAIGVPLVLAVALAYRGFVMDLPQRSRLLLVLAAGTFVGGAIGVEMLDAITQAAYLELSVTHTLVVATEESLERLGIAIFIFWLLSYIRDELGVNRVRLG